MGDDLTDYDETNGMGTSFGLIKTDTNNRDTDGDGLSDAEKMGTRHYNYYYMISDPCMVLTCAYNSDRINLNIRPTSGNHQPGSSVC